MSAGAAERLPEQPRQRDAQQPTARQAAGPAAAPAAQSVPATTVRPANAQPAFLSIGSVLSQLRDEFPGMSISKIRFLEQEGLVEPKRTTSNYRKFTREDVERLRYVLRAQRDHYLPLRVIKEHLESMDRGLEPPPLVGGPRVPEQAAAVTERPDESELRAPSHDLRLSRSEVVRETGLTDAQLRELESFGLITAQNGHFDATALEVARIVASLHRFAGFSGRHLARFRNAVDRELDLCRQVLTPQLRHRDPAARARAEEQAGELSAAFVRLHATLVRSGLRDMLDGG